MTPVTNLGTNSADTKDWLEVTKHQSISEWVPKNMACTAVSSERPREADSRRNSTVAVAKPTRKAK